MSNFATLKKSSSTLERLTKEIEKSNSPAEKKSGDDRFWKLERDKSGNGSAVIRFLPVSAADGEDGLPWVRYFDHGFQGPTGKWYIETSLTTLNQKDPVSDFNSELWGDRTIEDPNYRVEERKQARKQKRRLHYISNIYVVSDPKNPENEGKVFLFKYGKKIFDKITMAMNPEFEGDKPMNPFDLWKGANFKIRIRTVDGYPNYDQSLFDASRPLNDDDDRLEAIWKKQHSLKEFVDPSNLKSYDQLKKRLDEVLGFNPSAMQSSKPNPEVVQKAAMNTAPVRKTAEDSPPFDLDEDDEDLDAFKRLALG